MGLGLKMSLEIHFLGLLVLSQLLPGETKGFWSRPLKTTPTLQWQITEEFSSAAILHIICENQSDIPLIAS